MKIEPGSRWDDPNHLHRSMLVVKVERGVVFYKDIYKDLERMEGVKVFNSRTSLIQWELDAKNGRLIRRVEQGKLPLGEEEVKPCTSRATPKRKSRSRK